MVTQFWTCMKGAHKGYSLDQDVSITTYLSRYIPQVCTVWVQRGTGDTAPAVACYSPQVFSRRCRSALLCSDKWTWLLEETQDRRTGSQSFWPEISSCHSFGSSTAWSSPSRQKLNRNRKIWRTMDTSCQPHLVG